MAEHQDRTDEEYDPDWDLREGVEGPEHYGREYPSRFWRPIIVIASLTIVIVLVATTLLSALR